MLACQMPPKRRQPPVNKIGKREVFNMKTKEGRRMYKDLLYEMEVRQNFKCAICERTAGSRMEFDHQDGRGSGGGNRTDAIIDEKGGWINAALCSNCNTLKGSKRYKWVNGKYVPVSRFKEVA
jgi:hypothetical protein